MKLLVTIQEGSKISDKGHKLAEKFNIDISQQNTDVYEFVSSFFKRLLYHREKIKLHLFDDILPQVTREKWTELLCAIETGGRHLISIDEGSVVFTVFLQVPLDQIDTISLDSYRSCIETKCAALLEAIGELHLDLFL